MQVSEQIIEVLDNLAQKFGVVIDWGKENVIPCIQQLCDKYIAWEVATSIVWICLGIVLAIVGYACLKFSYKWHDCHKDDWDYYGTGKCVFIGMAIACWIVALGVVAVQIFDIVKCYTFPELQIFEFIKSVTT